MSGASGLRALLRGEAMVIAPGAYDGLTAKLVAQAGFPAVYMTGAGTSVSHGYPDFGLLTMSEMVENAARIVRSVDVPVIADADTGYGNELNVFRTVQEYERRGVAAIHIEDQVSPKKCGHLDDKEIVPREDYIAKIRAAVAARRDGDFMIIARTDARAVAGLDEALARANASLAAGADMAFVEAPQTMDELAAVPKRVAGPCLLNVVRGGKTPEIDLRRAQADGLPAGDRARVAAEGGDRRLRRDAGRTEGDARASGAAQRHDGARGVQPGRRRGMGCAAHALPRCRGAPRGGVAPDMAS